MWRGIQKQMRRSCGGVARESRNDKVVMSKKPMRGLEVILIILAELPRWWGDQSTEEGSMRSAILAHFAFVMAPPIITSSQRE
jgi:hypothetical protein